MFSWTNTPDSVPSGPKRHTHWLSSATDASIRTYEQAYTESGVASGCWPPTNMNPRHVELAEALHYLGSQKRKSTTSSDLPPL